jgi:hypothetical protein
LSASLPERIAAVLERQLPGISAELRHDVALLVAAELTTPPAVCIVGGVGGMYPLGKVTMTNALPNLYKCQFCGWTHALDVAHVCSKCEKIVPKCKCGTPSFPDFPG